MNKGLVWMGAAASTLVIAWAGCAPSSGGGTGATGGTGTTGTTGTTGSTSSSSGTGGAGTITLECTVPASAPSNGSCVTLVAENDAGTGIECNPVTNAPCGAGEECDVNSTGNMILGFVCYPPPNSATVCQTCDPATGTTCVGGETCFPVSASGMQCARYCCTDADCGGGTCTKVNGGSSTFGPLAPDLGFCTTI